GGEHGDQAAMGRGLRLPLRDLLRWHPPPVPARCHAEAEPLSLPRVPDGAGRGAAAVRLLRDAALLRWREHQLLPRSEVVEPRPVRLRLWHSGATEPPSMDPEAGQRHLRFGWPRLVPAARG